MIVKIAQNNTLMTFVENAITFGIVIKYICQEILTTII